MKAPKLGIPALRLSNAIIEAVSDHADRYAGGKVSVETVLSGLGEAASEFLAQIPDQQMRNAHRRALVEGIETTTTSKRLALEVDAEGLGPQ
jgi:hypothetical protein